MDKHFFTTIMAVFRLAQQPPSVVTLEERQREVVFWNIAAYVALFFNHLMFMTYSAAVLGFLGAPFWLWIIWGTFVFSTWSIYCITLFVESSRRALIKLQAETETK